MPKRHNTPTQATDDRDMDSDPSERSSRSSQQPTKDAVRPDNLGKRKLPASPNESTNTAKTAPKKKKSTLDAIVKELKAIKYEAFIVLGLDNYISDKVDEVTRLVQRLGVKAVLSTPLDQAAPKEDVLSKPATVDSSTDTPIW